MCAKQAANQLRLWLNQYALSGYLSGWTQNISQELPDVTCLSDEGPRFVVGNYGVNGSLTGFFEPTDDGFDEYMHGFLQSATTKYLGAAVGQGAAGQVAYENVIDITGEPRTANIGGAILLNCDYTGAGQLARGMVNLNATISGDGNQTGQNHGASTAGQTFQAIVRVISATALTRMDIHIEESQNDGGADPYADIAGMSQTEIAAAGVWRLTTTAATEAWKRCVISNWNGTSALVVVTMGICS